MSEDQQFVTVESAARSTGISARTLRYWIATGKLTATAEKRGKRVLLADVERLGRLTGKVPGTAIGDPATVPGSATATAEPLPVTSIATEAERQLATLRDGLVAPLVELTERQQERIAEQAETIGKLTAERDAERQRREAAESALSALEAQQAESTAQASSAPETATDAVTDTPRKQRQRRWWLRLFGVDE